MCMCLSKFYVYHIHAGACGGQKRTLYMWELGLQAVVRYPTQVFRSKSRSSARVLGSFSCDAAYLGLVSITTVHAGIGNSRLAITQ